MKKSLMWVGMIALSSASLFAQEHLSASDPEPNRYEANTPAQEAPAGLVKIFSNLGPAKSAFVSGGWFVAGPTYSGGQHFIAMPFTAKSNSTVTQVQVAVQYDGSGANQIALSIYTDIKGAPGTLIDGPVTVTGLSACCKCCTLTVGTFSKGVSVLKGKQYWVVADTPKSGMGSDFLGVWNWVPPAKTLVGFNQSSSWSAAPASIQEPAGAVYGTIP